MGSKYFLKGIMEFIISCNHYYDRASYLLLLLRKGKMKGIPKELPSRAWDGYLLIMYDICFILRKW